MVVDLDRVKPIPFDFQFEEGPFRVTVVDRVGLLESLTLEAVADLRQVDRGVIPRPRKTGLDRHLASDQIGTNTEKALGQGTCPDTDRVGKVAVALATRGIEVADLPEVQGRSAQIHIIECHTLHQAEGLFVLVSLPIGQRGVHHLGRSDIVDRPDVGLPIARGGEGIFLFEVGGSDRQVGQSGDVIDRLLGTHSPTYLRVDGVVDGPKRGRGVQSAVPHQILVLGPMASLFVPKGFEHRFLDRFGLLAIGSGVLSNTLGNAGCFAVGKVVVGRGVGYGSAVVVECIAGPDAGVAVVEMVTIGVKIALLPRQMELQCREYLTHKVFVARGAYVAQQGVDIDKVHIVV